nr:ABC-2 transporter permease [Romboutsia sp. 1001713B170207_170306_H8]
MNYSNLNSVKSLILLSMIIFICVSIVNTMFLNVLIGIIVYQVCYQVIAYEEHAGIDYLVASLPITKKEYVASRYIFSLSIILMAGIVFSICYLIAKKYSPESDNILEFKTLIIMGITSSIILISILIPLVLKFGLIKGRSIITIIMMIMLFVPSFAISSLLKNEEFANLIISLSNIGLGKICILMNLIILIISYILSKKIYKDKEII